MRRVKKVGNFRIFEAAITRDAAQRRLIDDLLALFGGRIQPAALLSTGPASQANMISRSIFGLGCACSPWLV